MRRRLGCLATSGIVAALSTLFVILAAMLIFGGRLFSPGPLSSMVADASLGGVRSHAETGGRCSACHAPFWSSETMTDRCLVCHVEVGRQLQDRASLHGALAGGSTLLVCRDCHSEHLGADASLTMLDPATFPHDATGFTLSGHQRLPDGRSFSCADCHSQDIVAFDQAFCADCHSELDSAYMRIHSDAFGSACLSCHDGLDTYGQRFDHNQTAFPLGGKHTLIECADCHIRARSSADLQATPAECYNCHRDDDDHDGQFGQDCASCHATESWDQVTFDHSLAAFVLTGAHVRVNCLECHVGGVFGGTPTACLDCHDEPVYHIGLLGTACADCHNTGGWAPARFDRNHTFPINHGEGGASPCQTCHPNRLASYTCYGCHEHDPTEIEGKHREEGIGDFQDCVQCHPTGREDGEEGD